MSMLDGVPDIATQNVPSKLALGDTSKALRYLISSHNYEDMRGLFAATLTNQVTKQVCFFLNFLHMT